MMYQTYGDSNEVIRERYQKAGKFIVKNGKAFAAGAAFALATSPRAAFADDKVANAANQAGRISKDTIRRMTNAAGCSAAIAACKKAGQSQLSQDAAVKACAANPQLAAAFVCGAAVAWCTKYVIFDR